MRFERRRWLVYQRLERGPLANIERGFRVLESHIEIARVHHRSPERIRAHALICILALLLPRDADASEGQRKPALAPTRAGAPAAHRRVRRADRDSKCAARWAARVCLGTAQAASHW